MAAPPRREVGSYERRRAAEKLLPRCCVSRLGEVKSSYESEELALEVAERASQRSGDELEVYPCYSRNGRWHIRKVRRAA